MTISWQQIRDDRAGARAHADQIQLSLDQDLELWRWAAEALPARERDKLMRAVEREHAQSSGWLVSATGEAFAVNPPKRHRIGLDLGTS
jgi:hypothetical protein